MCHRLDGRLIAVGCLDICKEYVNSAYFIYDPEYRFLNLGIIGALREIEYMRMTGKRWYVLGDLIVNCPKVNYKLQYKPGYVPCPRTKKHVRYDDVKDLIELIKSLPIEEKRAAKQICFCGQGDELTLAEVCYEDITKSMQREPIPILKNEK